MMKRMALVTMTVMGILACVAVAFGQEGADLSAPEQQAMSDTVQHALENNKTHQSSDWVNPDTGNSGGVTPVRTFTNAEGQPCREFVSTIIIGGEQQQGYGTACRQPDGTWQIVPGDESTAATPPPPATQTNIYVDNPPPQYYYYPPDFYYPYHIYLSFGYVYRGGYFYRGAYFMNGRNFRHRYPIHIRERVFVTPRDRLRYHRLRGWWEHRRREKVFRGYGHRENRWERQERRVWRDRDRGHAPRRGRRDRGGHDRGRR
jgi:surface antigen